MSQSAGPSAPIKRSLWESGVVTYGAVALAVWLGWEVVKAPIVQRAPPEIAVRLAPTSPEVLRRAAEGELAAKRLDNAAFVARASIARAPVNPQALRVLGLALADSRPAEADDLMTLAGNLSLRDNATHAWLIQQRLRRGNYVSSFAHADTLVRRRRELGPQVFALYTAAAMADPRAMSALVGLVAGAPPWREEFLNYLHDKEERTALLGSLVLSLEQTPGRLSDAELRQFYGRWRGQNRIAGLRAMRERLNRPAMRPYVQNGDFEQADDAQILPFGWTPGLGAGISASIVDSGEAAHGRALWIEYDGYASGVLAEQALTLPPGRLAISGEWRADGADAASRVKWSVVCLGSEQTLVAVSPPLTNKWARFAFEVQAPAADCQVQALRLSAVPGDRRIPVSIWIDNIRIAPAGREPGQGGSRPG